MARPTDYSEEIAIDICSWLIQGKSVASYCKQENTPTVKTIYNWLAAHKEFLQLYAQAKQDSADTLTDESLDIADNVGNAVEIDGEIVRMIDAASVAHARLRIDTRKWYASKLKPKKYGDKIDANLNHTGELINKVVIEFVDAAK